MEDGDGFIAITPSIVRCDLSVFNYLECSTESNSIEKWASRSPEYAAEERLFRKEDHVPGAARLVDEIRGPRKEALGITRPDESG